MNDLNDLHRSVTVLRDALATRLDDLLPPYADEVLIDLEAMTADRGGDASRLRALVDEASSVMEMLPEIPAEWGTVYRAACAAGLVPAGT